MAYWITMYMVGFIVFMPNGYIISEHGEFGKDPEDPPMWFGVLFFSLMWPLVFLIMAIDHILETLGI